MVGRIIFNKKWIVICLLLPLLFKIAQTYECSPTIFNFNPPPVKTVVVDGITWYYLKNGTTITVDPGTCIIQIHTCSNTAGRLHSITNKFDVLITSSIYDIKYTSYRLNIINISISLTKEKFIEIIKKNIASSKQLPINLDISHIPSTVLVDNTSYSWDSIYFNPLTRCCRGSKCYDFSKEGVNCKGECVFECGYNRILEKFMYTTFENYLNSLSNYMSEDIKTYEENDLKVEINIIKKYSIDSCDKTTAEWNCTLTETTTNIIKIYNKTTGELIDEKIEKSTIKINLSINFENIFQIFTNNYISSSVKTKTFYQGKEGDTKEYKGVGSFVVGIEIMKVVTLFLKGSGVVGIIVQ